MTKETGGSAFPAPNYICDSARIDKDAFQRMGLTQGMTLRDYFAGQALVGVMASPHRIPGQFSKTLGKDCYTIADAMIAAR